MKTSTFVMALVLSQLHSGISHASPISVNFYVDDRATVFVDGSSIGSYNNPASAGNIIATLDLAPGWHDLSVSYANQAGTNYLTFAWEYPGDPAYSTVPLNYLRSLDQNGNYISGLRADYYTSWNGTYQFTVYGEGPILNGATSFNNEIYEGVNGLWAGRFGPSAIFGENLSGQFLVTSTPEPSSAVLGGVGVGLLLVGAVRGRRRRSVVAAPRR